MLQVGATKPYRCDRCGCTANSRPIPPPPALALYGLPEGWSLIFTPPHEMDLVVCMSCTKRPLPEIVPGDRGRLINEHATLGMRLTQLRAELPEVEKLSRKTPRRDMPAERAKVEAAKLRVAPLRDEIAEARFEMRLRHLMLKSMGAYGTAESNSTDTKEGGR